MDQAYGSYAACQQGRSPNSRSPDIQSPLNQNPLLNSVLGLLIQVIQQLLAQSGDHADDPGTSQSPGQPLTLSDEQKNALSGYFNDTAPLAYDGLATEFTGNAYDSNGDGQLSAGDTVELRRYGGLQQADYTENVTLTADDLAAIQGTQPPAQLPEVVSGGGVSVGRTFSFDPGQGQSTIVLADDQLVDINGQQYSVGFLKQQVDDFASSSYGPQPGEFFTQELKVNAWGTSNGALSARFEAYISDNFPNGAV